MRGLISLLNMGTEFGSRYSKVLRTWIWISLGLVVVDVSRKVSDFLGPCFQKYWSWILDGFDIWLRLGKNVTKRDWEEGVRILLGMKR